MTEPAKKKPAPGWYNDPKDSTAMRKWDGESWLDEYRPRKPPKVPWAPGDYFIYSIATAIGGGILGGIASLGDPGAGIFVFSVVVSVSSIFLGIGIVAKGVQAGIRASK